MTLTAKTVFIIEKESTLGFDCGTMLYLSLISLGNEKYMIEVSSNSECIGRRNALSKKVAEGLFELVYESYERLFFSSGDAIKLWKTVFTYQLNIEMVFVLRVYGEKFDQSEIGQMITKYNLKVESEIAEKNEEGLEPMKIELSFPGRDQSIGTFVGHFLKDDFRLEIFKIPKK